MTNPLGEAETWRRTSTGPARTRPRMCTEMTWTPSCRATGSRPILYTPLSFLCLRSIRKCHPKDKNSHTSFVFCSGLSPIKSFPVQNTAHAARDPSSLKKILLVWTSSWRKPSNTAARKGHRPPAARKTTTTTRSAGKSEQHLASMLLQNSREVPGSICRKNLLLIMVSGKFPASQPPRRLLDIKLSSRQMCK